MKKIPTLFERQFDHGKVVGITSNVKEGLEWVLEGAGTATVKIDGSCCAIINGTFYKRYDAKKGKTPPEGAIPCCEADPITGHHPHWVAVDENNPADKWFVKAWNNTISYREIGADIQDGTYEAVGPHFQGNPHNLTFDVLIKHGETVIDVERSFEGIMQYLADHYIEGIVFWFAGEPRCKIKRSDFGFSWNAHPTEKGGVDND